MDKDHVIRTYTQWRISSHKEQNSIILKKVDELKVVLSKKSQMQEDSGAHLRCGKRMTFGG